MKMVMFGLDLSNFLYKCDRLVIFLGRQDAATATASLIFSFALGLCLVLVVSLITNPGNDDLHGHHRHSDVS